MTGQWTPEMQELAQSVSVQFKPTPEMFVCMDPTGCYHVCWTIEQHRETIAQVGAVHEQRYEKAVMPDRLKAAIEPRCWIRTAHGWTISIGKDTEPAIASVAAWPSDQEGLAAAGTQFFRFTHGGTNERCFSIEDVRAAIREVENAGPA